MFCFKIIGKSIYCVDCNRTDKTTITIIYKRLNFVLV